MHKIIAGNDRKAKEREDNEAHNNALVGLAENPVGLGV
jgi:hypothetical protein